MAALLGFMLVFAAAPLVGDQFQASLLTNEQINSFSVENPDHVRKVLLNSLDSFVDDCERLNVEKCSEQGRTLMEEIAVSGSDVMRYSAAAELFAARYEKDVAIAACKYDLSGSLAKMKGEVAQLNYFIDMYSDVLPAPALFSASENLQNATSELDQLVQSCIENS
jgi:hypothetical protein